MKIRFRGIGALLLLGAFAFAEGQTFSNVMINGQAAHSGQISPFGTTGLTFNFPPDFVIGKGAQDFNFSFRVNANQGQTLSSMTSVPVGVVRDGTVTVTSTLSQGNQVSTWSQSAGATLQPLRNNNGAFNFTPASFYDVNEKIHIATNNTNGLAHLSVYNVSFKQCPQPVPEPLSLSALALGLGGIMLRRRRGN